MTSSEHLEYRRLLTNTSADGDVVGLVLVGSRAHGTSVREDSDWDARLIVSDDRMTEVAARYRTRRGGPVEVALLSRSSFLSLVEPDSPLAWDRYSYARGEVAFDKLDGAVQAVVAELTALPGLRREPACRVRARRLHQLVLPGAEEPARRTPHRSAPRCRRVDGTDVDRPLLDAWPCPAVQPLAGLGARALPAAGSDVVRGTAASAPCGATRGLRPDGQRGPVPGCRVTGTGTRAGARHQFLGSRCPATQTRSRLNPPVRADSAAHPRAAESQETCLPTARVRATVGSGQER